MKLDWDQTHSAFLSSLKSNIIAMKTYPHNYPRSSQISTRTQHLSLGVSVATLAAVGTLSACVSIPATSTASNSKLPAVVVVVPTSTPIVVDAHNTRNSIDWEGYYTGTIPCASCEGINVWLNLKSVDNTTRYTLVENYLGNKSSSFRSSGNAA